MSRYGAVLDACVLVPMSLTDTLLRLAEQGLFHPFWSDPILEEVARALRKQSFPEANVHHRLQVMREVFPEAMVPIEGVTFPSGLPDPDDDHVLEAAIRSDAQAIVTLNLDDFPLSICSAYGIDILSPDDFLVNQFDLSPNVVCQSFLQQARDLHNPPIPITVLLNGIRQFAPMFADLAERELT